MRTLGILVVVFTLAAAAVSLSACGGDDSGASEDTTQTGTGGGGNEQLCSAVGDLEGSVNAVKGLDENSSVDEIKSAVTGVVDAGKEVASAAEAGPQADLSGLQSSVQDLEDAVKSIPSSGSVQKGLQGVEAAADSVAKEAKSVSDSVGCDGGS